MAVKGHVFVEGFGDAIDDLDFLSKHLDEASAKALNDILPKVEGQMKSNAVSAFAKGYTQNVMVNSISYNVTVKDGFIAGRVGVFDMPNKTGSEDRKISGRRISEPLIAFFYETGIRPHSTRYGARLAHPTRGKEVGQEGVKLHRGSAPIPFLSSAFDVYGEEIFTTVKNELGKLADKQ